MRMILASLVVLSGPAWAGVEEAVGEHLLPGYAGFALATEALAAATQADCAPETWRPALAAAFDAWGPVADIRLGPAETAALSIAFWPDERGATARALASSSNAATSKPTLNVFTGASARAVTRPESIPPDKQVPAGTSATSRRSTERSKRARNSAGSAGASLDSAGVQYVCSCTPSA